MPKTVDYTKMSHDELTDVHNRLVTSVNNYSQRSEDGSTSTLSPEDVSAWKADVDELEVVNRHMSSTPEGLRQRSASATIGNTIANVSNSLNQLSGSITVRESFERDPRFGFRTDNEFLRECLNATRNPDKADKRIIAVINAVGDDEYSKGKWQSAGILIPETMIDRILSMTPEADFITPRCTRIPMGTSSVKIPARVDKDHSTSVTGGTRVYRTKETGTVTKTKDTFEMVALEASEIVGEAAATKQLIRESPISIAALIEASMGAANVDKRIDELLLGSGNGVPLGVLNAANQALITVDRTPGQADTEIVSGMDVIRMAKQVYGYSKAIWIANYDLFEILNTLVIESPNNAGLVKLFSPVEGGLAGNLGVVGTLWGRPCFFTEYAPGIASGNGSSITEWDAGFLSCINFSEVLYGEMYQEFNRSVHVRFSEREEVFQFVTANDARPWWKTYLTPKRGITTRSPFVQLNNEAAESA